MKRSTSLDDVTVEELEVEASVPVAPAGSAFTMPKRPLTVGVVFCGR